MKKGEECAEFFIATGICHMSVMASQITHNSTDNSAACLD